MYINYVVVKWNEKRASRYSGDVKIRNQVKTNMTPAYNI